MLVPVHVQLFENHSSHLGRVRMQRPGSGFMVLGSGFWIQGWGFRIGASGFRVQDRFQDSGSRIQDSGCRVQSSGGALWCTSSHSPQSSELEQTSQFGPESGLGLSYLKRKALQQVLSCSLFARQRRGVHRRRWVAFLFHPKYELKGFGKSTPQHNRQLNVDCYLSKQ